MKVLIKRKIINYSYVISLVTGVGTVGLLVYIIIKANNVSVLAPLGTLVAAISVLVGVLVNTHRIKKLESLVNDVHSEVKTGNSQTLAQLADAEETRRIDKISPKNRTSMEKGHLKDTK